MREIDRELAVASPILAPSLEQAAALFADLPRLWDRATAEERAELLRPLFERVYVDMEERRIAGLQPTPEFNELLGTATRRINSDVVILTHDEATAVGGVSGGGWWSWWRRGSVKLSHHQMQSESGKCPPSPS